MPREVYEVVDNQEVAVVAHAVNNFKLVIEPRSNFVVRRGVAGGKFFIAKVAQIIGGVGVTFGQREFGHLKLAELKRDVATVGNRQGVVASFGHVAEEGAHFLGGLQIVIVGGKLQPLDVIKRLAGLNAK